MVRGSVFRMGAAAAVLMSTGCVVVAGSGWTGGCGGIRNWKESTQTLRFDAADLNTLAVKTHNGSIRVEGESNPEGEVVVTATKKGGGANEKDAEAALAAIEVFAEDAENGTKRIGWRWTQTKKSNWQAKVSFQVHAPSRLHFQTTTHNGGIRITDSTGNVKAETHNGGIHVASRGKVLDARTHNGGVDATFGGSELTLTTYNGGVIADLKESATVSGKITTFNGAVKVTVGERTAADLVCLTQNGRIRCGVPLADRAATRRKLTGSLGGGGGELTIHTYNGSVRIGKASG